MIRIRNGKGLSFRKRRFALSPRAKKAIILTAEIVGVVILAWLIVYFT